MERALTVTGACKSKTSTLVLYFLGRLSGVPFIVNGLLYQSSKVRFTNFSF